MCSNITSTCSTVERNETRQYCKCKRGYIHGTGFDCVGKWGKKEKIAILLGKLIKISFLVLFDIVRNMQKIHKNVIFCKVEWNLILKLKVIHKIYPKWKFWDRKTQRANNRNRLCSIFLCVYETSFWYSFEAIEENNLWRDKQQLNWRWIWNSINVIYRPDCKSYLWF